MLKKKATEDQFNELHNLVTKEFLSRIKAGEATTQDLKAACDWLEYKTDRRMSAPGLKKHIDKKYGLRSERLGTEPSSLLAR